MRTFSSNTKLYTLIVVLFAAILYSCDKNSGEDLIETQITWKDNPTVDYQKGVSTLLAEGIPGSKWTASITEGSEWCSFSSTNAVSTKEGTLGEGINAIYLYYSQNTNDSSREAVIEIKIGQDKPVSLTFTQKGPNGSGGDDESFIENASFWPEIPAYQDGSDYQYVTHYEKLGGKNVRNYSMCYDKSLKAALWVAYPLHKCYIGSVDRTDQWIYNPYIDETYQIYVSKAYKEYPTYDRGHQIPSADRTITREMNTQTFYFTNQTPQIGVGLNQSIWANLENKIRTSYMCTDTLYVVTGAHFDNTSTKATDNNGVKVPVPTHYFKVLLRTKSGITGKAIKDCNASELITIGFWLENKSYSNPNVTKDLCKKVSDIEKSTGFTFFPGIPEEVKNNYNAIDWNLN